MAESGQAQHHLGPENAAPAALHGTETSNGENLDGSPPLAVPERRNPAHGSLREAIRSPLGDAGGV
jgi:hypothetical protein